ncbi:hypothetical protein [Natronorubrum sp. FCH18a]
MITTDSDFDDLCDDEDVKYVSPTSTVKREKLTLIDGEPLTVVNDGILS